MSITPKPPPIIPYLFYRDAGAAQVRQFHLGVLARKQNPVGAGAQGCPNGVPGALRAGLALRPARRNVDVDARPELRLSAGQRGTRALRFAVDIVGREAGLRKISEVLFLFVVEYAVMEIE